MFASNSFWPFLILATISFMNAERFKRSPILTDDVAQENQFPYAVAIISNKRGYICSGGIIDEKFILTAAHCFIDGSTNFFRGGTYKIYAGTRNYTAALGEKDSRVIFVARIFVPRDFDFDTRTSDIAVLELAKNLDLHKPQIQKLRLPPKGRDLSVGDRAVTAAFGVYGVKISPLEKIESFTSDGILRYADIMILNKDAYRDVKPYGNYEIQDFHLLGGMLKESSDKYGMCYGDSGSSLVHTSTNTKGKTKNTVFGVFVDAFDRGCDARTLPAIFTKVSPFLEFIGNAMNNTITDDMRQAVAMENRCHKLP